MKAEEKKDLCLWFVRPRDGRVRKLRLSVRRLLTAVVVVAFTVAACVFAAGDYARVQLLRAKNYLFLMQVTRERDELLTHQRTLLSEVDQLKDAHVEAKDYERTVQEKLDALASILEASRGLGLPDARPLKGGEKGGLGGAEIDCEPGSGSCPALAGPGDSPMAMLAPEAIREPISLRANSREEMLALLDQYIAAVRVIPLAPPGRGRLTSGYGYRISPFSGKRKLHQGIDLSLPVGAAIYSTGDGVVKSVKRTSTYGLVIDIAHTDRMVSRYAHLSKSLVKEGDTVVRGAVIGLVGSSGRSTGPHLHYEVRVDGRARDPRTFLALAEKLDRAL